jgi:DNA gyrase subunit A
MTVGSVRQVNIGQEMREAYLDYAMSVIVSRALPDARDGLKPVHRRILYAMYDMGIRSDTPYKKSARIVGEVLGKYHPHGDAAVYETLVRLAQDFSMRYPLIDGQGNFGSIDGDGAAAMRYTEARMADIGEELLVDIEKETVNFADNFDGTLQEPTVLPSSIPNLLISGSSGIAVGMSTNIPPHNLNEVCDALVYMLGRWDELDDITVEDLMKYIIGPDFPTGGLVYRHKNSGQDEDTLVAAYATGRGKLTMRARVHTEDMGRGKSRIIVTELPYQTNKSALVERIATLARDGKVEGIADLRDESDRQGLRLSIELQRGVDAEKVLELLFKLTPLEDTFGIIMLALVNNEPRLLSLKQALRVYLEHRQEVVRRRSEFDLERARARAHILEGLLKALDNLDEVISIIRKSRNAETARNNLVKTLKITEIQAQAILDMQLRRLAALEHRRIQDEYQEKLELIAYLEGLLSSPEQMRGVIAEELSTIKQAYGNPRRTIIVDDKPVGVTLTDLTPKENTWVTLTVNGKLGRTYDDTPPKVTTATKVPPRFILDCDTSRILYLFTAAGTAATLPVHQLPQVEDPAEGTLFNSLAPLPANSDIVAMVALPTSLETGFIFFVSEQGEVKRLRIEDLPGLSANELALMDVETGDRLGWVLVTDGNCEVMLTTRYGQAIRFKESDVRPTGLSAGGMRGIKLKNGDDRVIGAVHANDNYDLWIISSDGIAKSTPMDEYPTQGRAGSGVLTAKLPKESPGLAATATGKPDDNIIVLTSRNKPKYMRIGLAPRVKRAARGDFVISLNGETAEEVRAVVEYQPRINVPEPIAEEA